MSCHTAATYALARPALRGALGETAPSASERSLHANVTKRVMMWKDVEPFYPDQTRGLPKTSESRGTEAILNALVLSGRDARGGALGDDTRRAFENMWALQFTRGDQSGIVGVAELPPRAVGGGRHRATTARRWRRSRSGWRRAATRRAADIQDHKKLLRDYLRQAAGPAAPVQSRDGAVGVDDMGRWSKVRRVRWGG